MAARAEGLELETVRIDSPREIAPGLKRLLPRVDILWALPDRKVFSRASAREIMLSAFRARIPIIGTSSNWVRSGALFALERNYADIGMQSADMVIQLAAGTSPLNIPPVEPRNVSYTLNLRTAEHMHTSLPAAVTERALKVFQ